MTLFQNTLFIPYEGTITDHLRTNGTEVTQPPLFSLSVYFVARFLHKSVVNALDNNKAGDMTLILGTLTI